MTNRRKFSASLIAAAVAFVVVAGSALADELLGVLTKVDIAGKKVTVVEKGTDKEVEVTVTDKTEWSTKDGFVKIDLEKVEGNLTKAKEKGAKGIPVKVEHEKAVASKISRVMQKKAAPQQD